MRDKDYSVYDRRTMAETDDFLSGRLRIGTAMQEMDLLSDVLSASRLGASQISFAHLLTPWGIAVEPMRNAAIHLVQAGECWLRLEGRAEPIHIGQGDMLLVAGGVAHQISNPPDAEVLPMQMALAHSRAGDRDASGEGETTLLCAKLSVRERVPNPLVPLLPPLVLLTRAQVEADASLRLIGELLRIEADGLNIGRDIVAPRLLDSALVFLLRAWLESQPVQVAGWFAALRDPAVARALRLIHAAPARPWSVESLASSVGQSRATFARRFAKVMGEPPLTYIARWRMNMAARALAETSDTVDQIAHRVGYESTPSFSQAFQRIAGRSPGEYRKFQGADRAHVNTTHRS
ncbi:AraC family transcriptional regulator [Rhizobium binae]|uniref:AraC family transcriptional regulator n=1 Tax=Rhizobium binae TaxID=1138190 RepID=UPI001C830A0B|nr:AraC family transcriptional regulator [Rhizobium binae]MBX4963152.1 AraC family transcriptional regulator [Rhizobium binae]